MLGRNNGSNTTVVTGGGTTPTVIDENGVVRTSSGNFLGNFIAGLVTLIMAGLVIFAGFKMFKRLKKKR